MKHAVRLTGDAAQDLEELIDYIDAHDSPAAADRVLGRIEKALISLSQNPGRGAYPKELSEIGVREYREILFKPYRMVYRVAGNDVFVMLIADGRRDMQALLERRILNA